MGVMECRRDGCSGILCDTYVNEIGYVCRDCKEEFKSTLDNTNHTEGEYRAALKEFMDTWKGESLKTGGMSVDDFFENYTK